MRFRPLLFSVLGATGLFVGACAQPHAATASSPTATSPMAGKRVEGTRGMVAASQPEAAAAGAEILRAGGNAVDAFVATAFALSVTDVSQTGLGGGGAMTFYDARTRRVEHLSFYPRSGEDPAWGRPPAAAPRAGATEPGRVGVSTESRGSGPDGRAAATPGMVAGLLEAHGKWGTLPLARVMAPAIRLAREGFVVSPLLARTIVTARAKVEGDSTARARFMPNGVGLRPGETLVQPELAATLERIRDGGRAAFYTGPIAERLAAKVRADGGLITVGDLRAYPVTAMRPLCTTWRGYTVLGAPPPMGTASVLEMLQMAQDAGLAAAGRLTDQPDAVVKLADILRLGDADGDRWRGDPRAMRVPARGVVHPAYAKARAGLVGTVLADTARAGDPWPHDSAATPAACAAFDPYPAAAPAGAASGGAEPAPSPDDQRPESFTSHLAVVDANGSAVSATTTIGVLFGSGIYTDGFWLNSAASNFDARTRGPNRYANSTMSPTLILQGTQVRLVVGAAGSAYIQPAVTQVTLRMLAFGEDPFLAVAAPRIWATSTSKVVEVEPGFTPAVYQALITRGYATLSKVADITMGGVHAIFVNPRGVRIGVADPRRDGVAVAQ